MIKVFFGENEYESYQDLQRQIIKLQKGTEVAIIEADEVDDINNILGSVANIGLFDKPSITICKRITKNKSKALIDKFVDAKIILDITPSRERNKIYAFTALIKII